MSQITEGLRSWLLARRVRVWISASQDLEKATAKLKQTRQERGFTGTGKRCSFLEAACSWVSDCALEHCIHTSNHSSTAEKYNTVTLSVGSAAQRATGANAVIVKHQLLPLKRCFQGCYNTSCPQKILIKNYKLKLSLKTQKWKHEMDKKYLIFMYLKLFFSLTHKGHHPKEEVKQLPHLEQPKGAWHRNPSQFGLAIGWGGLTTAKCRVRSPNISYGLC